MLAEESPASACQTGHRPADLLVQQPTRPWRMIRRGLPAAPPVRRTVVR